MKDRKHYFNYYRKSKHGRIVRLLLSIKNRCTNQKIYSYQRYGGRGIRSSLTYSELSYLYDRDNASKLSRPSIDRVDNDGNYSLENCRFIEFSENCGKDKKKSILQIDKNGKVVNLWNQIIDARKDGFHHSCIIRCCNGERKTHGGFHWKYA